MHACVYTNYSQSLGITAQRTRPPSGALAFTRLHPILIYRVNSDAAGPSAREGPQAAHEGVAGRWRWKLAERCRALAA